MGANKLAMGPEAKPEILDSLASNSRVGLSEALVALGLASLLST